jgi:hypothetical protein
MGLSARTRETDGGTARTLAGSVRDYAIHYTGIVDVAYLARRILAAAILGVSHRFPEPCGPFGLQPSPKLFMGGPMRRSAAIPSPSPPAAMRPATCPFCRSSSILTTAKIPDVDSYWRCAICGEVWNVRRSVTGSSGAPRWR